MKVSAKSASTKKQSQVVSEKVATPKKAATKKSSAKKSSTKKPQKEKSSDVATGKRSFKIVLTSISPAVDIDNFSGNGGKYTGNTPMQAGKKSFTNIARKCSPDKECTYVFSIQETTEGSKRSTFTYEGTRTKLEEPQKITKQGKEYLVKFKTAVKAYKATTVATKKRGPRKQSAKTSPANTSTSTQTTKTFAKAASEAVDQVIQTPDEDSPDEDEILADDDLELDA